MVKQSTGRLFGQRVGTVCLRFGKIAETKGEVEKGAHLWADGRNIPTWEMRQKYQP